jgi:HD-GYP domain-containing protein (c-di-GMP phosphodiesterase class II)
MCTDRPYRRATPPARALGVLQENAGPQVDPVIAATFVEFVGDVFGVAPEPPPPRDA